MATTQTEDRTGKVVALLGGNKVFRGRIRGTREMRRAVRRGLPFQALDALMEALDLGLRQLGDILGLAPRTLARRRQARRLSPIESDRLYRVAYITSLASDTFGAVEKGRLWMRRPNRALDGRAPLHLLDTEIGERQVEDLLNRINYGIYT